MSTDAPGTENTPGSEEPVTDLSIERDRDDDAAPAAKAVPGELRTAADGPKGVVVVGRPSAPDGEVGST